MHYSGGMCSQKCKFSDPCISMEECVANTLVFWTNALRWRMFSQNCDFFGPMHYSGGMCSQNCEFLDPCIIMEECVAKIVIFWTHALQWRNV